MAIGSKSKTEKSSSKKGKDAEVSSKRYVASVWENEGKKGTYLSLTVDNLDKDDKYYRGNLIWSDVETGKFYKVKSMNIYEADKGPDNLLNKLVIDLDNEYHVEEIED